MIKSIYFPGKQFATKDELFKELRENANKIIALKKLEEYKSFFKGYTNDAFLTKDIEATKTGPHMKDGYVYPIINTTKYLDSHDDVHLDGIWNRSAKEQQGKIYYTTDHKLEVDKIITWPGDVNIMVKSVPWSFVGKDYAGNTEALIYEIDKSSIVHPVAKQIIDEKRPVQNSVRMQYVKIQLGMNSNAKEDIDYKKYFDLHIESIANKEVALERGYFFGVEEAKIVKEGSMVVLGSNDATAIRQKDENTEADTITSEKIEQLEPAIPATLPKQYFLNANLI